MVLAAMAGHQDQLLVGIKEREARRQFGVQRQVGIHAVREVQQGIDHRVAGDEDAGGILALGQQIVPRL
ncbi:hypothetical protein D3C72_2430950 [compost metagenome]